MATVNTSVIFTLSNVIVKYANLDVGADYFGRLQWKAKLEFASKKSDFDTVVKDILQMTGWSSSEEIKNYVSLENKNASIWATSFNIVPVYDKDATLISADNIKKNDIVNAKIEIVLGMTDGKKSMYYDLKAVQKVASGERKPGAYPYFTKIE